MARNLRTEIVLPGRVQIRLYLARRPALLIADRNLSARPDSFAQSGSPSPAAEFQAASPNLKSVAGKQGPGNRNLRCPPMPRQSVSQHINGPTTEADTYFTTQVPARPTAPSTALPAGRPLSAASVNRPLDSSAIACDCATKACGSKDPVRGPDTERRRNCFREGFLHSRCLICFKALVLRYRFRP